MKNEEINNYLDNREEVKINESILNTIDYKILNQIDNSLRSLPEYKLDENFTFNIIKRIKSGADILKAHKKFARVLFTSFISIILVVVTGMFAFVFSNNVQVVGKSINELSSFINTYQDLLSAIKSLFNTKTLPIVVSITSLFIFSIIYFIGKNKKTAN